MNQMWHGMPPLMDRPEGVPGMIPPPPGAVMGGQPEIHSAFPGYQQQQQHQPPNWLQGAGGPGTPWPNAGAGPSWHNGTPAPSWANTPMQPSPWQQQHQFQQQQTPSWVQPQMPRPGWGPAPQGMGPHAAHGFSAMAAPPLESASGQPVTTSWFNTGAGGGGMPGRGGQMQGRGGMHVGAMLEEEDEPAGLGDEEWDDVRTAWARAGHDPRAFGHGQDPRAAFAQGQDPRAAFAQDDWGAWGQGHDQDPRPTWAQDPRAGWGHEGAALTRSHSQGQLRSPGKRRKRSNSFGGGQLQGGWGAPATFDENHLSRRPEDWRDGYSPRGISGADISFSSLFRVGKKSETWTGDTKKRTLATVLSFNATRPKISYDLRRAPEETSFMGNFQPLHRSEMMQLAVTPPVGKMRLMHPRLPWYIDVVAGFHTPGVTLYDVLGTLFNELNRQILSRDFWNEELGKREREGLTRAFKERCSKKAEFAREEMLKGVKRVDFLGLDCVFVGLVRRNGMWEIKTESDH
ncbi:hypothetical protein B0H13DRAFT_2003226 [Mycena leptocephala]|nr:hypothetical protein B0H13DRAFT_2003226 [Mycena leptocephala]